MFGFFPGVAGVGVVGCVSRGCGWSYCVSRDVFSARHNKPGSFPPLLYTVLSCAHAALVGGEESLCVPLAVVVPARVQLWGWLISR